MRRLPFNKTKDVRVIGTNPWEGPLRKLIYGLIATAALVSPAMAQVKVGVIVSATGPAASVGVTQQRTV